LQWENDDLKTLVKLLSNGSNRAFITDRDWYEALEYESKGTAKLAILEEIVLSDHWGFRFEVNSFMYEPFNRKIVQLVESGLADVFVKNATKIWRNVDADDKHVSLTLAHLSVWFYLWLILMVIALLVFVLEVCRVRAIFKHLASKFDILAYVRRTDEVI
jgi:hypothetical protein